MIIDRLENSGCYAHNAALKAAFDYLKSLKEFPVKTGRIEICKEKIFANIDRYQTKPHSECRLEAHREYIDIQILYAGKEVINWYPVTDLSEEVPYNQEQDVAFFQPPEQPAVKALLKTGIFMLLYPEDAHMPQIAVNDVPEPVEKIVMKIKVN